MCSILARQLHPRGEATRLAGRVSPRSLSVTGFRYPRRSTTRAGGCRRRREARISQFTSSLAVDRRRARDEAHEAR